MVDWVSFWFGFTTFPMVCIVGYGLYWIVVNKILGTWYEMVVNKILGTWYEMFKIG